MRIGVTSQNFKTITGHAGKARRFLVYEPDADGVLAEVERLDLSKDMSMHEYHGDEHPIFSLSVLITGGCGDGFKRRLATQGVRVITTSETDISKAVNAVLNHEPLAPAEAHDHGVSVTVS